MSTGCNEGECQLGHLREQLANLLSMAENSSADAPNGWCTASKMQPSTCAQSGDYQSRLLMGSGFTSRAQAAQGIRREQHRHCCAQVVRCRRDEVAEHLQAADLAGYHHIATVKQSFK